MWLDEGCHTLILFAPALVLSAGVNSWGANETNSYLTQYIGAAKDLDNPQVFVAGAGDQPIDSSMTTSVSGVTGAFAGQTWSTSTASGSTASYHFSIIGPAAGVDTLATVQADPSQGNSAASNVPVAVAAGHKHVGANGSSTVVWVGFTVETIDPTGADPNTLTEFFTAVQNYAGLP